MVRHNFPGLDADGYLTGFDRAIGVLREHRGRERERAATLDAALSTVLALWLLRREDPAADWAGERLTTFHEHVTDVLTEFRGDFAVYQLELDLGVESETPTGWYRACFIRSVVEVLVREAGLPRSALAGSDWLEATDAELREAAKDRSRLPGDVIPRGMPPEHWWWFIAQGPYREPVDH